MIFQLLYTYILINFLLKYQVPIFQPDPIHQNVGPPAAQFSGRETAAFELGCQGPAALLAAIVRWLIR